jgi:hypothetical protein
MNQKTKNNNNSSKRSLKRTNLEEGNMKNFQDFVSGDTRVYKKIIPPEVSKKITDLPIERE